MLTTSTAGGNDLHAGLDVVIEGRRCRSRTSRRCAGWLTCTPPSTAATGTSTSATARSTARATVPTSSGSSPRGPSASVAGRPTARPAGGSTGRGEGRGRAGKGWRSGPPRRRRGGSRPAGSHGQEVRRKPPAHAAGPRECRRNDQGWVRGCGADPVRARPSRGGPPGAPGSADPRAVGAWWTSPHAVGVRRNRPHGSTGARPCQPLPSVPPCRSAPLSARFGQCRSASGLVMTTPEEATRRGGGCRAVQPVGEGGGADGHRRQCGAGPGHGRVAPARADGQAAEPGAERYCRC